MPVSFAPVATLCATSPAPQWEGKMRSVAAPNGIRPGPYRNRVSGRGQIDRRLDRVAGPDDDRPAAGGNAGGHKSRGQEPRSRAHGEPPRGGVSTEGRPPSILSE